MQELLITEIIDGVRYEAKPVNAQTWMVRRFQSYTAYDEALIENVAASSDGYAVIRKAIERGSWV